LKTFGFHGVNSSTIEFMGELVRSGTFENLEEFDIGEYFPGVLTMKDVELLIQNCPHFKIIKGLKIWQLLEPHDIKELKHRLLMRNIDIHIK
jgi:hypothetical protein